MMQKLWIIEYKDKNGQWRVLSWSLSSATAYFRREMAEKELQDLPLEPGVDYRVSEFVRSQPGGPTQ